MKWNSPKSILTIMALFLLPGCSKKVQSQAVIGKPKVTKTITETTKTERQVPLTKIESTICTNTKTITSDGTVADPLHTATVPIPQAAFKVPPKD